MARADTKTLLSLDRWARIMGINPMHFNGGQGSSVYPTMTHCGDLYPQYAWQVPDSLVSREEIALAIFSAEQDIKRILGYSPALTWEANEPSHYAGGSPFSLAPFKLRYGHVKSGGRRAVDFIDTYPLTFVDLDGDGFEETATITIPEASLPAGTYPKREIKLYFEGKGGSQNWEIRYPRRFFKSGTDWVFYIDAWMLFDPEITHAPTTPAGFTVVDIENPAQYVTELDAYREYNNPDDSIEIVYLGCDDTHTASGCLKVGNRELGIVAPSITDEGSGNCGGHLEPLDVRTWYQAGDMSDDYMNDLSADPLDDYWAQTIAWMATARLEKNVCSCSNVREVADALRRNVAASTEVGGNAYNAIETISNPFGSRVGEVRAWYRAMNMANGQIMMSGAF